MATQDSYLTSSTDVDFTAALVAVFMSVVRADKVIRSDEEAVILEFFQSNFHYGPHQMASVEREIEFARTDDAGLERKAQSLVGMPAAIRELILDVGIKIALADGKVVLSEREWLVDLARLLELDDAYVQQLGNRLDRWVAGKFSENELDFHRLGLEVDASVADITKRYESLKQRFHPGKLSSMGEEFAILSSNKIDEITLAYERLLAIYSPPLVAAKSDSATFASLGVSSSLEARLRKVGTSSPSQLLEPGHISKLLNSGIRIAELQSLLRKKDSRRQQLDSFATELTSALRSALVLFLLDSVRAILEAQAAPVKLDKLRQLLKSQHGEFEASLLQSALSEGTSHGDLFDCESDKWALSRILSIPVEIVQELWQLAVFELESRGGVLYCYELGWRKHLANVVNVRVDFALSGCPQLQRVKPGTYSLAAADPPVAIPVEGQDASSVSESNALPPVDFPELMIEMLPLRPRTKNCLTRRGIVTVRQLLEWTPRQLLQKIPSFGQLSWQDLAATLEDSVSSFPASEVLVRNFLAAGPVPTEPDTLSSDQPFEPMQALQECVGEVSFSHLCHTFGLAGTDFASVLPPELDAGALTAIEGDAYEAIRTSRLFRSFVEELKSHTKSDQGWVTIAVLQSLKPFAQLDEHTVLGLLRILANAFPNLAVYDSIGVFTTDDRRTKLLLDQKYRARHEFEAPRTLGQLAGWLRDQFVDLDLATAERVIRNLWQPALMEVEEQSCIVVSYGEADEIDEIAALIFAANRPITPTALARLYDNLGRDFPLDESEIHSLLCAHPEKFVCLNPGLYELWSNLNVLKSSWADVVNEIEVVLWTLGIATNGRWVMRYLNRHNHNVPAWLTETSLMSLLAGFPEQIEVVDGKYIRPTDSGYPVLPVTEQIHSCLSLKTEPMSALDIEHELRWCIALDPEELQGSLNEGVNAGLFLRAGDDWSINSVEVRP